MPEILMLVLIYAIALFQSHTVQSKIKYRVLVTILATEFQMLVARTESLGGLVPALGTILCPEIGVM